MAFLSFNRISILLVSLGLSATSCGIIARSPSTLAQPSQQTPAPAAIDSTTPTQIARSKRVSDYFLEIPSQYLQVGGDQISSQQRQQLLDQAQQGQQGSVYDLDNGYLQLIRGGDSCPAYTVAIFSRPSASPLVTLNVSCAAGDQVSILDPDQNWQNVTDRVLPASLSTDPNRDDYPVEVKLPRVGRTIEVRRQRNNQPSVARYTFNGQRFIRD
jgi:hypothetical protein